MDYLNDETGLAGCRGTRRRRLEVAGILGRGHPLSSPWLDRDPQLGVQAELVNRRVQGHVEDEILRERPRADAQELVVKCESG